MYNQKSLLKVCLLYENDCVKTYFRYENIIFFIYNNIKLLLIQKAKMCVR